MSTFTPDHVLHIAAKYHIAGELPGLSVDSLRELAAIHRRRGERLSAEQYEALADEREEVDVGEDSEYEA